MLTNTWVQLNKLYRLYFIEKKKKEKRNLFITTYSLHSQQFHLFIFSCLLKRMVLPSIMKTEKNFQSEKILTITQFEELQEKSAFLKIEAEAVEAEDFLKFSCILGVFEANFLINIFLIKKACNENLIYFPVIELIQRGHR